MPPRVPRHGELPFEFVRASDQAPMTCELRFHGELGVEAQFLARGELSHSRRFDLLAQAVQWAEEERKAMDGRVDGEPDSPPGDSR